MKTKNLLLTLMCMFPFVAQQVRATSYTYSDTIDLSNLAGQTTAGYQTTFTWNLNLPSITLFAGDTFTGTINFANNHRIQIYNAGGSSFATGLQAFPVDGPPYITPVLSETTTLLNVQGSFTGGDSQTASVGGLVPAYYSSYPSSLYASYSGFTYSATVSSIPGATSSSYLSGGVLFAQVNGTSGTISVVPEPSTYALFGLGALVLVMAARRRRTA